jgi:hypothetical protein
MFKAFLSTHLRTRYIALLRSSASCCGHHDRGQQRDVRFQYEIQLPARHPSETIEAHSLEGIEHPAVLEREVRRAVCRLAGLTATVHLPAMLSFQVGSVSGIRGRST